MKKFEQRELIKKNKTKRINKSLVRRDKKFSTIVFKFVDASLANTTILIDTTSSASATTITTAPISASISTPISTKKDRERFKKKCIKLTLRHEMNDMNEFSDTWLQNYDIIT